MSHRCRTRSKKPSPRAPRARGLVSSLCCGTGRCAVGRARRLLRCRRGAFWTVTLLQRRGLLLVPLTQPLEVVPQAVQRRPRRDRGKTARLRPDSGRVGDGDRGDDDRRRGVRARGAPAAGMSSSFRLVDPRPQVRPLRRSRGALGSACASGEPGSSSGCREPPPGAGTSRQWHHRSLALAALCRTGSERGTVRERWVYKKVLHRRYDSLSSDEQRREMPLLTLIWAAVGSSQICCRSGSRGNAQQPSVGDALAP